MNSDYLESLKQQLNNRISFREKRPGIVQLVAPFYHEDGDMLDIFYEDSPESGKIRITDYGMSIMRLSYTYDINTQNKERILQNIITENGLNEEGGSIFTDVNPNQLYQATLQFIQAIAKVSSMSHFGREVIKSMFYEMLGDFIKKELVKYNPQQKFFPLDNRGDLEVDYSLEVGKRPIFLFGVKGMAKARLTTICCLEFRQAKLPFKSFVVHEEFETLPKKDRSRLTSAADKQFISLEDFKEHGEEFIEREIA